MAAKLKRLLRALLMTGLIFVGSIFSVSSVLAESEEDEWEHETICDGFNRLKISWDSTETTGIVNVSGQVSPCNSTDYPANGTYEYIISQDSRIILATLNPDNSLFSSFNFEVPFQTFEEETMFVYPIWKTSSGPGDNGDNDDSPEGDDGLPAVSPSLPSINLLPMYECIPHEPWNIWTQTAPPPYVEVDFQTSSRLLFVAPNGVPNYNLMATTACNGYPIYINELNWLDWHTQYYPLTTTHCEIHYQDISVLTATMPSGNSGTDPVYSTSVWDQSRIEVSGTAAGIDPNCALPAPGNSIAMNSRYFYYDNLNLQLNSKWNVLESQVTLILLDSNNNQQKYHTNSIRPIWVDSYNYDYTKYGAPSTGLENRLDFDKEKSFPMPYTAKISLTTPSQVIPPDIQYFNDRTIAASQSISSNSNVITPSGVSATTYLYGVVLSNLIVENASTSPECSSYNNPIMNSLFSLNWSFTLHYRLREVNNQTNEQWANITFDGSEADMDAEIEKRFPIAAGPSEDIDESMWLVRYVKASYNWRCEDATLGIVAIQDSGTDTEVIVHEFQLTVV